MLSVSISSFLVEVFQSVVGVLFEVFGAMDQIIIIDGADWSLDSSIHITLLDFNIGLTLTAILVGAFVRLNRADEFYNNRRD